MLSIIVFIRLDTDSITKSYFLTVHSVFLYQCASLSLSVPARSNEDVCLSVLHPFSDPASVCWRPQASSSPWTPRPFTLSHSSDSASSPPACHSQPSLETPGHLISNGEHGEGCGTLAQEICLTPGNLRDYPLPAQGFHDVSTLTGTENAFVGVWLFLRWINLKIFRILLNNISEDATNWFKSNSKDF